MGRFMIAVLGGLALVAPIALANPALADQALAKISCSVYGAKSDDAEHRKIASELYLSGVQDLFDFLTSVEDGSVTAADLNSSVPMVISWSLNELVVSKDFAAGSITQTIVGNAAEDYLDYQELGHPKFGESRSSDLWSIEAERLFRERNCSLLGRAHSIKLREVSIVE